MFKVTISGPSSARMNSNVSYRAISDQSGVYFRWYKSGREITRFAGKDTLQLFDVEMPAEGDYYVIGEKDSETAESNHITLKIGSETRNLGPLYIHDLRPERDCGFIYMGYWVIDEITSAVNEGFDWVSDPKNERFVYQDCVTTLANGFSEWADLEIMESRNGYILRRKDLGA